MKLQQVPVNECERKLSPVTRDGCRKVIVSWTDTRRVLRQRQQASGPVTGPGVIRGGGRDLLIS
jgi:hypothetical protein